VLTRKNGIKRTGTGTVGLLPALQHGQSGSTARACF